jgi:hypothetical protein
MMQSRSVLDRFVTELAQNVTKKRMVTQCENVDR